MVFYPFYIQKQSNDLDFEKSLSTEVKQKYWNNFLVFQHLFVEFINLSSYIFEVFVKFWLVFMRTSDMTLTLTGLGQLKYLGWILKKNLYKYDTFMLLFINKFPHFFEFWRYFNHFQKQSYDLDLERPRSTEIKQNSVGIFFGGLLHICL